MPPSRCGILRRLAPTVFVLLCFKILALPLLYIVLRQRDYTMLSRGVQGPAETAPDDGIRGLVGQLPKQAHALRGFILINSHPRSDGSPSHESFEKKLDFMMVKTLGNDFFPIRCKAVAAG